MSEWISVEERLPEDRQNVLTYWAEKQRVQLQTCYHKWSGGRTGWWMGGQNLAMSDGYVTHWMPLPEGPEKVE